MKKIRIEIYAPDNNEINPPGTAVAWELICLSKILSMPAYKDDENAIRNRMSWYEADSKDLIVRVKID